MYLRDETRAAPRLKYINMYIAILIRTYIEIADDALKHIFDVRNQGKIYLKLEKQIARNANKDGLLTWGD